MRGTEKIAGYRVAIYDNGGKSLDRYSVVLVDEPWNNSGELTCLSLSVNAIGISMFGSCVRGRHLGKRIPFASLTKHVQNHIISRLSED